MATITITIPDAQLTRVVNAFCDSYGWDATLGVAKGEFARQQVAAFVHGVVQSRERLTAESAALATVVDVPVSVT